MVFWLENGFSQGLNTRQIRGTDEGGGWNNLDDGDEDEADLQRCGGMRALRRFAAGGVASRRDGDGDISFNELWVAESASVMGLTQGRLGLWRFNYYTYLDKALDRKGNHLLLPIPLIYLRNIWQHSPPQPRILHARHPHFSSPDPPQATPPLPLSTSVPLPPPPQPPRLAITTTIPLLLIATKLPLEPHFSHALAPRAGRILHHPRPCAAATPPLILMFRLASTIMALLLG